VWRSASISATVWTNVAIPLLLAFAGGAIAVFWPWLQSWFRGRKFQGLIRGELKEVGPYPLDPVNGKPWWEHATKRFVHEEIFARERVSENRDFLLSLNPPVVYRVSQLWTALAKRDSTQWLHFLDELATDRNVGSNRLREAARSWHVVVDAQPEELKVLPRVRRDGHEPSEAEQHPGLFDARLEAYAKLLALTKPRTLGGTPTSAPRERGARATALTGWFYEGGGLLLSGDAHNAFYAARGRLEDERATDEEVRDALSALRTELKIDLGVRRPDERDIPMAPSQARTDW
jgi:hypothetical protein